ncbi:MAG TPA: hypothetical protein VK607_16930 [Kofleriaceae bacterium]|nr:hypothetical protein [Kofleriaceae bacterium]
MSLAGAAGSADAKPKRRDARVAFDRGVAAYQKGSYQAAADALGKSYAAERDPETLFAWAQAERKLDHCDKAIGLYEQLLTFALAEANRTAVEQKLAECRTVVAQTAPPPSEPVAAPPPPPPPPVVALPPGPAPVEAQVMPMPPPVARRTWYTDPVALGLLGAGVVAGGVATGFFVSAQGASDDSNAAAAAPHKDYTEAADFKAKAEQRGRIAIGASIAAGVLVVGGVGWILWKDRGREQPMVSLWLPSGGGGLAIGGPF